MDQVALIASIASLLTAFGGWKFVSYMLNRNTEKREREIKNRDLEMDTLRRQIDWMQKKYEAVSKKLDDLYVRFRDLEEEKIELMTKNHELQLALKIADYNKCVRPDDECIRRLPVRDKCRLRQLLSGKYESMDELMKEEEVKIKENDKQNGELLEILKNVDSGEQS